MERKIYKMKKVLFATVAAVMSTTAAMADVSISDYQVGKAHALAQVANKFDARGINIVENSNRIAVHKTVNAWNQGWNALEGDNEADLDSSVSVTTLYMTDGSVLEVESSNLSISADGMTATINTGEGIMYDIAAADVATSLTQNVNMRDVRAAEVSVEEGTTISDAVGSVGEIVDEVTISIAGTGAQLNAADTFAEISDKVEYAVQNSYDAGFEDGYTAGYNDGFAAAKGVVKN